MGRPSSIRLALGSITPLTGACAGAAAAAAYLAGGFAYDVIFGRPSPTGWAITIVGGLPVLGGFLAIVGALAGLIVQFVVRRFRLAGPVDLRYVAAGLTITCVVAALAGVAKGRSIEALNGPRILHATPTVVRVDDGTSLPFDAAAVKVLGRPVERMTWQAAPLGVCSWVCEPVTTVTSSSSTILTARLRTRNC